MGCPLVRSYNGQNCVVPDNLHACRYARILAQQAERLRTSHEHSRRVLEQLEAPFSFYERDKERTAAASAAAAALAEQEAATPQAAFKATPVPAFIKKVPKSERLVCNTPMACTSNFLVSAQRAEQRSNFWHFGEVLLTDTCLCLTASAKVQSSAAAETGAGSAATKSADPSSTQAAQAETASNPTAAACAGICGGSMGDGS